MTSSVGERPAGSAHPSEVRTYYGRPVLKAPVWRWPVPAYFFTGGVAAGSSLLAFGARCRGDTGLARRTQVASLVAVAASDALLVEDLGRPARFANMLRVAKVTSPMSVGSWLLAAFAPATGVAAACDVLGVLPRVGRAASAVAASLAPAVASYTAVVVADTAVPAWHEARRQLPFVFVGSAAASTGGLGLLLAPPAGARPARRLAVGGAVLALAAARAMERHLGELGAPYREGRAARLARAARASTATGAGLVALAGARRRAAGAGGLLLMAGSVLERFAVFHAGVQSAADPAATIGPQRRRLGPNT